MRMTLNKDRLKRIELIPVTIDDEGPLYGVPRLAGTKRGEEILELLRTLSAALRDEDRLEGLVRRGRARPVDRSRPGREASAVREKPGRREREPGRSCGSPSGSSAPGRVARPVVAVEEISEEAQERDARAREVAL